MSIKNHNRLEQITHYVIARMPADRLGAVKLAKIMWLADIISQRQRRKTITGIQQYRRLPQGPVPTQVRAVLNDLVLNQSILERDVDYYGKSKKELISLREPDLSSLSAEDVDILNRSMQVIEPLSASEVSKASHDIYWEEVPPNGMMSVDAASVSPNLIEEDDLDWANAELKALGLAG